MQATATNQSLSPWITAHAGRIPAGATVLDVAAGSGRHARYLANMGHHVTLIDIDLAHAADLATDSRFTLIEHDLERGPWPFSEHQFGAIVIVNYLHRPLLKPLGQSIVEGGVLLYDTFAAGNEKFGRPSNPDYLLQTAELLKTFGSQFRVKAYEQGPVILERTTIRQRFCGVRCR